MLEQMKKMALAAGEICLQAVPVEGRVAADYKGATDLVTAIDRRVETFLTREIMARFPGHRILGEEQGESGDGNCRWVIDPIDGTTSFVHGLPGYCVSIAFQKEDTTRCGVVYAPALNQLFSAELGRGAYLNNRRIQVSPTSRMIESVWATGFACVRARWENNNLAAFTHILPRIRDVRRMGAAALDLAYVAAGKLDGFWEMALQEYDVAAGILLVREAGGVVCDFHGGGAVPEAGTVAANGVLQESLRKLLAEVNSRPL